MLLHVGFVTKFLPRRPGCWNDILPLPLPSDNDADGRTPRIDIHVSKMLLNLLCAALSFLFVHWGSWAGVWAAPMQCTRVPQWTLCCREASPLTNEYHDHASLVPVNHHDVRTNLLV